MTFTTKLRTAAASLALVAATALTGTAALAEGWTPSGPIKMMVAFRAGGGADTLGRLLAEELKTRQGWDIIPENVTGKGGATMANALKSEPADGLAIGVTVSEATTYNVQAMRNPGYSIDDFDYISTLTGSQMGIIAKADRGWTTLADVIAAAKAGEKITIGAMSPKLSDGAYVIAKTNGIEFTTVMVKGGKGGLNGVVADDLDIAWAAGVQTPGIKSGDLVNLVSAESGPLRVSPDAPLLSTFGVPFAFGVKFMVIAPAGLDAPVKQAYMDAIAEILNDPDSKVAAFANRAFSGPEVIQGDDLRAMIDAGYADAGALLDASAE